MNNSIITSSYIILKDGTILSNSNSIRILTTPSLFPIAIFKPSELKLIDAKDIKKV